MSWYVKSIGAKADVVAELRAPRPHGPVDADVVNFICTQIGKLPDSGPTTATWLAADWVFVEGSGHGGNVGRLRIEGFTPVGPPK